MSEVKSFHQLLGELKDTPPQRSVRTITNEVSRLSNALSWHPSLRNVCFTVTAQEWEALMEEFHACQWHSSAPPLEEFKQIDAIYVNFICIPKPGLPLCD